MRDDDEERGGTDTTDSTRGESALELPGPQIRGATISPEGAAKAEEARRTSGARRVGTRMIVRSGKGWGGRGS